jgi:hypothetical protein
MVSLTISPTLAVSISEGVGGEAAPSQQNGEAAKKADFLVAGTTFNREARLVAQGDVLLVVSDGVGWQCCRGLLLAEVLPLAISGQVGAVRGGEQWGGMGGECTCCDPACRLDQPMIPEGEAGGQGWESVT